MEDLDIDGRIVLEFIVEKYIVRCELYDTDQN